MINEFRYGQTWKIWPSPLSLSLYSTFNNLKSEETKSQTKAHLSYLANSNFYNCKASPHILRQHRVLRNLRKNKDIAITKPSKGNAVPS